jgi:DNA-binding response OmpR family regulator
MNRVLIIDDESSIVDLLSTFFKMQGFNVDYASHGEMAFVYLSKNVYELIILDYMLPGMDGAQVLQRLAEDPKLSQTKVIISSAAIASESDWWTRLGDKLSNAARSMVKEFVGKPYDIDRMRKAVEKVLTLPDGDMGQRPLARELSPNAPKDKFLPIPQQGNIKVLYVEDEEDLGRSTAENLRSCGYAAGWCINGQSIFRMLAEAPGIDILILDLALPDMSGDELIRRLVDVSSPDKLRVIVTSGKITRGQKLSFIESFPPPARKFISSVMPKPIMDIDDLVAQIRKAESELKR